MVYLICKYLKTLKTLQKMLYLFLYLLYNKTMKEFRIENDNIIYTICEYDKMDYQKLKKHMHPFYEILYLLDGEINYIIEDKEYRVKKGELLIIDSAKFHYVKDIISPPYKRICFEFINDFVGDDKLINNIFIKTPHFILPDNSPIPDLLKLIEETNVDLPTDYHKSLYQSALKLILLSLFRLNNTVNQPKKSVSKTCKEILTYINDNITSINNIDQIVNNFFYSKSYISHVFKQEMQVGIMHYVRNKKIILADKLLKLGNRPTEVAKACGYENYISFYRTYLSFFNRPPSETKQKNMKRKKKKV